uniref:Uncharacterized protein n=1 Tax=Vitis vinifera TaxID=29760 RepID=A5CBA9_VITVI|nr:hypothetical protein VITISV_022405 [Vitis vinifera]
MRVVEYFLPGTPMLSSSRLDQGEFLGNFRRWPSYMPGTFNALFCDQQFRANLRLPLSFLVRQFLYHKGIHPVHMHSNTMHILRGCAMLNRLYALDLLELEMKYDIEDFGYESKLRGCIVDID